MRAIVPALMVILGLGAREYVNHHVPGGLARADRAAILLLVQQRLSDCVEEASSQICRSLQEMLRNGNMQHHRRSVRRHDHHDSDNLHGLSYRIEFRVNPAVVGRQLTFYGRERPAPQRLDDHLTVNLGTFGHSDASLETDNPVEVRFILPTEEKLSGHGWEGRTKTR
jgi:hypothetical protein